MLKQKTPQANKRSPISLPVPFTTQKTPMEKPSYHLVYFLAIT
jgi:hypothetical protein